MMNVAIEDAYNESCRALGESLVTQRLLFAEVQRLTVALEQAQAQLQQEPEPSASNTA